MPATLEDCFDLIIGYYSKQNDHAALPNIFKTLISKINISASSNRESDLERCPLLVKAVLKYCVSPARNGLVCNKAMIFMAGQSGAGKSSTINRLFNDDNLCPTSDRRSCTRDVVEIEKEVKFFDGELHVNIKSSLIFIDIPGNLNTEAGREEENYATVKRYLESSRDLAKREDDYAKFLRQRIGAEKCARIPDAEIQKLADVVKKHIRPNLVFLCVKSTDPRMEGTDSAFSKTLRNLHSLGVVDTQHPNLIVVVTCALIIPKNEYRQRTEELKKLIKKAFSAVFALTCPLPIVFVENEPEDYDNVKMIDGFLELPNGESSHLNLIHAMEEVFKRNKDALGMCLCGRYFSDNCPERNVKPKITVMSKWTSSSSTPAGVTVAASATAAVSTEKDTEANAMTTTGDNLPTHHIGHGFCLITETIKADTVLPRDNFKKVRVLGRERGISQCIDVSDEQVIKFEQITQQTKEEYETERKAAYGLDANINLVMSVSSQGKWVQQYRGSTDTTTISFHYVMQTISAEMTEIKDAVKPELMKEIGGLPSEYSDANSDLFNKFFSKWGTHFVSRVGYGGAIIVDCRLKSSKYNSEEVFKIMADLQGVFSGLLVKPKVGVSNTEKKSTSNTLSRTTLRFYGGNPPRVTSLESLTPEMFSEWTASLEQKCSELEHTVKLYPYYNLAQGKQGKSLVDATLAYLNAGNKKKNSQSKWWRKADGLAVTAPSCDRA